MKEHKGLFSLGLVLIFSICLAGTAFAAQAGWQDEGDGKKYVNSDGSYVTDTWKKLDGEEVYLDENGDIAKESWVEGKYYVGEDGKKLRNAWVEVSDNDGSGKEAGWYYFGSDGKLEKDRWFEADGSSYRVDAAGRMLTGWHYEDGDIYYLGEGEDGYARVGWHYLSYDKDNRPKEGAYSSELEEDDEDGEWFYFLTNGKARRSKEKGKELYTIDEKKYYFDENGVMLTGWMAVEKEPEDGDITGISRFVFVAGKDEGLVRNQFAQLDEHPADSEDREALLISGKAYKGPEKGEICTYYFDKNGTPLYLDRSADTLLKAAKEIDRDYYFFDSYGVMQTGLIRIVKDGRILLGYFDPDEDGVMATGKVKNVTDRKGETQTFNFETAGSKKGSGISGEDEDYLYWRGLLVRAAKGTGYETFMVDKKVWLVDENGRVQTKDGTYEADDGTVFKVEDGVLYRADENGEALEAPTNAKSPVWSGYDHIYRL